MARGLVLGGILPEVVVNVDGRGVHDYVGLERSSAMYRTWFYWVDLRQL